MQEVEAESIRREVVVLREQGKRIAALEKLDQLIVASLASASDWRITGDVLFELGEIAQAKDAFEQGLAADSDDLDIQYSLARMLYQLGDSDAAVEIFERLARQTGSAEVWLALASIAPGAPSLSNQRVHQIRNIYAKQIRGQETVAKRTADTKKHGGRPRIGYLSAHWSNENYMKPVWPMVNAHDTSSWDIQLYNDSAIPAVNWGWLSNSASCHDIASLSNAALAAKIASDEIDVLVDLSGYSAPQRLGVFVHRPARVQMAWFNTFATTGFDEIDFIIGDQFVVNPQERQFYNERCLTIPISYLTFQTNHAAPAIVGSPCHASGVFTFGSLGTQYKMTPVVIEAWASILTQAPDSQLFLANRLLSSECNRQYLVAKFQEHGIDAQRLILKPGAPHAEFLKYYDQIDLALDTFPYNGGTTTMESLWQGVPVLAFNGDRWASRTSRTLIRHSHVAEFDCKSRKDYINSAVQYATEAAKWSELVEIRREMRKRLGESLVCDSAGLASELEKLYGKVLNRS